MSLLLFEYSSHSIRTRIQSNGWFEICWTCVNRIGRSHRMIHLWWLVHSEHNYQCFHSKMEWQNQATVDRMGSHDYLRHFHILVLYTWKYRKCSTLKKRTQFISLTDNPMHWPKTYNSLDMKLRAYLECKSKSKWSLDIVQMHQLPLEQHLNLHHHSHQRPFFRTNILRLLFWYT